MPTFALQPTDTADHDRFWVYAIDDWDARSQIAAALGIDAHDETRFCCDEDNRFRPPLNVIVHSSGELTGVPDPTRSNLERNESCDCLWD